MKKDSEKYSGSDEWVSWCVGLIFGFFIGALMIITFYDNDKEELGQSICDQEYNMDFVSYNTKNGLECTSKRISKEDSYDGVRIRLDKRR